MSLESQRNDYRLRMSELEEQTKSGMAAADKLMFEEKQSLSEKLSELKTKLCPCLVVLSMLSFLIPLPLSP